MPRFYFDLHNHIVALDNEGLELTNLEDAEAEARCGAAEVISEQIKIGEPVELSHRIEIKDANHKVVFVLRFRDLVHLDC